MLWLHRRGYGEGVRELGRGALAPLVVDREPRGRSPRSKGAPVFAAFPAVVARSGCRGVEKRRG